MALGDRGAREGGSVGEGPIAVARKLRNVDIVAAKLEAFEDDYAPPEGVTPLNPGFFRLQRMKDSPGAKVRFSAPKGLQ